MKVTTLQGFKDHLTKSIHKMTVKEAMEKGLCINCHEEALPNCYSDDGRKEYRISGLCERCFDKICGEGT